MDLFFNTCVCLCKYSPTVCRNRLHTLELILSAVTEYVKEFILSNLYGRCCRMCGILKGTKAPV